MARTVVIGAGVVGLLTAYELQKAGDDVVVIDRGEPGRACSYGNAGWLCPSLSAPLAAPGLTWTSLRWMLKPDSPLAIAPTALPALASFLFTFWRRCNPRDYAAGLDAVARLGADTMERFDALVADGIAFEMHQTGLLFAFVDAHGLEKSAAEFEHMVPYGYPAPVALDGDAARALEPTLGPRVVGAIDVPRERHIDPLALATAVAERLEQRGAQLLTRTEVRDAIHTQNTVRAVRTTAGDIEADRFVIAAGAWSGRLARLFGRALPVQAAKGYSITLRHPTPKPRRALYLAEAKVGVSPLKDTLRFAGTLELSGINERLNRRRLDAIRRAASVYFAESPHGDSEEEWAGMRPLAPDSLPLIGRVPDTRNAWIATGHGMLGVTLAPSTAGALVALMNTGSSPVDLRLFDPARFV